MNVNCTSSTSTYYSTSHSSFNFKNRDNFNELIKLTKRKLQGEEKKETDDVKLFQNM